MLLNALMIDEKDNVATAVRRLEKGESAGFKSGNSSINIALSEAIPSGHKFAVKDIEKGAPVIKYGETIGLATTAISKGEHVHVHNVEGRKGRGDRL